MQDSDPGICSNNIMFSESEVGQGEQLKGYTGRKNLKVLDLITFAQQLKLVVLAGSGTQSP